MLTSLYIQNLAVIEKAYIEPDMGLNVFTGETGAGKSIVIDAVTAILGGRTSKEIVRNGADKAVISGIFSPVPQSVINKLDEFGIQVENDELMIQREISIDGKTTARICGMPVTVAMLKEIGSDLINIHGQHDNQKLLSADNHINILDSFGELQEVLNQYTESYTNLRRIQRELDKINKEQDQKEQRIDILTYQINEIEALEVEIGEDEELENESRAIKNSAKIIENLEIAHQNLSGSDNFEGAVDLLNNASIALSNASAYYSDLEEIAQRIENISIEVTELSREVSSYLDTSDFDNSTLDIIESRLSEIYKIKRKYGGSIESVLEHLEKAKEQLNQIEMYDVRLNELIVDLQKVEIRTNELAEQLTKLRQKAADEFVKKVSEELTFLDMPNVKLAVNIEPCPLNSNGKDKVEFMISANVGEPPKPIAKIASGGELSRIMLGIKNSLADKDEIPTLIFDEVDSGVSGKAAQKIGLKLKQAAKNRQIFCVTHSAQIAALANTHFQIKKEVEGNRTYTKVNKLDLQGRKQEIARIMGTDNVTDLMLQTAEQMLFEGSKA